MVPYDAATVQPFVQPAPRTSESHTHPFAAVDLGSNSFHLIVARFEHGELQVIDRLREMVRLAAGLDDDHILNEEARHRALDCLARFGQRLQGIPPDYVRALGTNTLRRARNRRVFLDAAETALGHSIEIISGHEEARLVYLGVAEGLASSGQHRLVVDIGGGSTEFIIGLGHEALELESLSFGCVGLSREFFGDGKITRARLKNAQTAVALELRPVRTTLRDRGWEEVVGSSGTVRSVAAAIAAAGWGLGTITAGGLKKLRRALEEAADVSNLDALGVSEQRAPVFPGGVAILASCFRNLGIDEMRVSESSLREGALYDLIGRVHHRDPRESAVRAMLQRYRVDPDQAQRVETTALTGFDQVRDDWQLHTVFRDHLRWAAQLHEVGLAIAHDRYNVHGAYLVEHSAMAGFSSEEQLILATLILGHRRKIVSEEVFGPLPKRLIEPVRRICAILRLAVLFHRSRLPDADPAIEWRAKDNTLTLAFPSGWLGQHPLTRADLHGERPNVRRLGITAKFK